MQTFISIIPWLNWFIMIYLIIRMNRLEKKNSEIDLANAKIVRICDVLNEVKESVVRHDISNRKLTERIRQLEK